MKPKDGLLRHLKYLRKTGLLSSLFEPENCLLINDSYAVVMFKQVGR